MKVERTRPAVAETPHELVLGEFQFLLGQTEDIPPRPRLTLQVLPDHEARPKPADFDPICACRISDWLSARVADMKSDRWNEGGDAS